jgi:ribonuclease P protein component
LRHAREFERVFERGHRNADDCFTVIAAANDGNNPRLGLAIAKRRAPRAVDRNRIKRIVRESFRHHAADLPAVDIVVLARPGTAYRDNARLYASLGGHWQRLATDASKG